MTNTPTKAGGTKARILIVEDEPAMVAGLRDNFEYEGYEVISADNGVSGLERALDDDPDLVVLDVMMPRMSGLEVCRQVKAKRPSLPIIMLTARGQEIDKVVGLELGADDYVTKPFSIRELMARIKAVLRRAQNDGMDEQSSPLLRGPGGLVMDVERRVVSVADSSLDLTRLEFDLLHRLLTNAGRVLTRERLLEQAWGYDFVGDTRAVDSAVKRLRAKLRELSPDADCIESVRGVGYRINPVKG
jgi:two-component system alkaline phosphatase synthesis response regulator PhoP